MLQLDWFIELGQTIWALIGPGWQDLLINLTAPIEIDALGGEFTLLELMFGYGLAAWLFIKIGISLVLG